MQTITIRYWQELPPIIASLKRSFSQLVSEWEDDFNPTIKYYTSIDFTDIQVRFRGKHWADTYHLFILFCEEYGIKPNVTNYLWLMEHTKVVNRALLGDEVFNQYVKNNGGYEEAEEFVENNKLVIWQGKDFEVNYNYEDMEMIKRLGMEIQPNKYRFRSKSGYYLPIKIKIKYNQTISQWVNRLRKDKRYQIMHTPRLTIQGLEYDSIYELSKYLYQEGYEDLIVQWAMDTGKSDFELKIHNTKILIEDLWKKENSEQVGIANRIHKLSDYKVKAFRVQDIIKHSTYSKEYGLKLDNYLFNKLRVDKGSIVGELTEVYEDVYGKERWTLGELRPISIQASGIKLETPYQLIEEGKYKESELPLVDYNKRKHKFGINTLQDTDLRIVLRKKNVREETDDDIMGSLGQGEQSNKKIPLSHYRKLRVDIDLDQYGITLEDMETDFEESRLTGEISDLERVPYILKVQEIGKELRVTYVEGNEEVFSLTDPYLRTRVVFRDLIGVDLREGIEDFTELILSLNTTELVNPNNIYERLEEQDEWESLRVIDEWIATLNGGSSRQLYQEVVSFELGETVEPWGDSILDDISII